MTDTVNKEGAQELDFDFVFTDTQAETVTSLDDISDESEEETPDIQEPEDGEEEEESPKPDKQVSTDSINYKSVAKQLIENGSWSLIDGFSSVKENEDGEESLEFEDDFEIDKETFLEIVKAQKELETKKATENKVDLNSLDETLKDAIEIALEGGDYTSVLKAKEVINPVEGLDPEDSEQAKKIMFYHAKLQNENLSDEVLLKRLNSFEKSGILQSEAKSAKEGITNTFTAFKEKLKEDAKAAKLEKEAKQKEIKEGIKKTFKEQYNTNSKFGETVVSKLDNGDIDDKLKELRNDPEKASDLYFYLLDPEEFFKHKFNNYKLKKDLEVRDKIVLSNRKTKNQSITKNKKQKSQELDMSMFLPE